MGRLNKIGRENFSISSWFLRDISMLEERFLQKITMTGKIKAELDKFYVFSCCGLCKELLKCV